MDATRQAITLSGGRTLDVWATETATPEALLHIPGTPCAGIPYAPHVQCAIDRGWRFVSFSRPGYSESTRFEGRSVADVAADVRELAHALGLARLHVVGHSGGGPHALACAALLPDLVAATATLAGVAPWGAAGLDWLAGMADENVAEFGAALAGRDSLAAYLEPWLGALATLTGEEAADALGGLVSDVDRGALTGEYADASASALRLAVAHGCAGWLDDDLAFTRDWGFDLRSIERPVTVWQGGEDRMVPFSHGQWLAANVPNASARLFPHHGHLSLAIDAYAELVDDLARSAAGAR